MRGRNLNWKLFYEKKDKTGNSITTIVLPAQDSEINFSCEFTIERSYEAKVNKSNIKIYNLSPSTRKILRKDKFETNEFDKISFYAGSEGNLSLIFQGNVLQAESIDVREVDIITEIVALDGSFLTYNSFSNHTINSNVPYKNVFDKFFNDFTKKAVEIKEIFSLEPLTPETTNFLNTTTTKQPLTLFGNSWEEMKKFFGGGLFIDNGKLNFLPINFKPQTEVVVLKAETGLKSVPKVSNAVLEVELIFSPKIKVGDMVEIQTSKDNFFNGKQFKVFGIKHSGNISQTTVTRVNTVLSLGRFNENIYYSIL